MRKFLHILIIVISSIVALSALLSLLRDTEFRYLKMLDFPRIQFFIITLLSLISLWVMTKKWKWYNFLLISGLVFGLVIQGKFLIHYTSLVAVDVPWAEKNESPNDQFSLLLTNVKMENREAQPLIELINSKKPDLILAMETDEWWNKQLNVLEKQYPFSQHTINDVAYGMILFSKFPLENVEVEYLNNENVPSFEAIISLASGKKLTLHSIHPVPPTNFEDLPDNEGQKETALQQIGNKIKDRQLPTIVAGDINDVVWSYMDELTNTKNILFDVRVGRGFYNSYNAENIFMRWPLDHVYVTKEFNVKKLERLSKIGSDHFPIFVELVL